MDSNGLLLQLIECIETIKSDVKKKMTRASAVTLHQSHQRALQEKFFSNFSRARANFCYLEERKNAVQPCARGKSSQYRDA